MKELVEVLVKALVDNPNGVQVTEVMGNNVIIIEVKVDKSDMGKVIGKHGQTASAIRTLLSATSAKLKKRAVLEILE